MRFDEILKRIFYRPEVPPYYRRYRLIVLGVIAALLLIPLVFVLSVIADMPSLKSLENPQTNLATLVISADKQVLGTYYAGEHRINVKASDIPLSLQNALIATEDIRFYTHSGVDPGVIPALIYRNFIERKRSGGSSITQQLARNLYDQVGTERTAARKIKEAIVATVLERRYTKEEILVSYFNTVPFGGTNYGVQTASKVYFNKDCSKLEPHESALLIALLKGASFYNPVRYPERALAARNTVLSQMVKYGFMTKKEGEEWKAKPLGVTRLYTSDQNDGPAPYFREYLRSWLKDWCAKRNLDIYTAGLRVYTTINSRMQDYAEQAVNQHLRDLQPQLDKQLKGQEPWLKDSSIIYRGELQSARYNLAKAAGFTEASILRQFRKKVPMRVFSWNATGYIDTLLSPRDSVKYYAKFLQPGLMTIDPANGHVLAWVGGLDHRFFQYDHVKLGKRQVGSTFKPFVYTAAFDNGFSPCHEELNMPVDIMTPSGLWSPKNSDGSLGGYLTLRKALANSVNIITARVIKAIGPHVVAEYAYKMGIESKLDEVPSLALGTTDLSVYELTSAYATFANKGRWNEPICVTRIEDKFGNVLQEFVGNSREALSEETAYLMVDMLRGVVNEGTAATLRWQYKIDASIDVGGKTGTTQQHADGWFVGITPYFATAIWVGCADRAVRFPTIIYGQGNRMAMPIWGYYMKHTYEDKQLSVPRTFFERPANLKVEIDCRRYRLTHPSPAEPESSKNGQKQPGSIDFDN